MGRPPARPPLSLGPLLCHATDRTKLELLGAEEKEDEEAVA